MHLFIYMHAYWTCTLSLHDALPIFLGGGGCPAGGWGGGITGPSRSTPLAGSPLGAALPLFGKTSGTGPLARSEEHTSELQSRPHPVCRLLPEKKKASREPSLDVSLS